MTPPTRHARRRRRHAVAATAFSAVTAISSFMPASAQEQQPEEQAPLPESASERARWAAQIAGRVQDADTSVTTRLDNTSLALQKGGKKALGTLTYSDGADTGAVETVVEENEVSTRFTFILNARPDNDDVTFNLDLASGVKPQILPNGQLVLWENKEVQGSINAPFAVDANGTLVRTWFELNGRNVRQVLDLSSPTIAYPVMVDPEYTELRDVTIGNHGGVSDYVHGRLRPTSKEFVDYHGYYPVWGYAEGVRRVVDNKGDACSWPGEETTATHNFWVPCEMHDYCWDLIRVQKVHASFYPEVYRTWCDTGFYNAMVQHCEWRPWWQEAACKTSALAYKKAVDVTTSPYPERNR